MQRKLLIAIVILLSAFCRVTYAGSPVDTWQRMLEEERKPLQFTQTVTTMFPERSMTTIDKVIRVSPLQWKVTRLSDIHGSIKFQSSDRGFLAFVEDLGIALVVPAPKPLYSILIPHLPLDRVEIWPAGSQILMGKDATVLERRLRGRGTIRYWVDSERYRLLKEEFLDEFGKIVYSMSRSEFRSLDDQNDHIDIPVFSPHYRIFGDEREWWQEISLARITRRNNDLLIPQVVPKGMYLVAAIKNRDGEVMLRYSDGVRVFSIFLNSKEVHRQEGYFRNRNLSVLLVNRAPYGVTIVGGLDKAEMEEIAESLHIVKYEEVIK